MAHLDASVSAVRRAVKTGLTACGHASRRDGSVADVLVACSGGADSLALAAAAGFVGPRAGVRVGLVTVDHGLQAGSADRASTVVAWARSVGLDPALSVRVHVEGRSGGPEAAAREARYEALAVTARQLSARYVLLGHTRDDQAETVLLAMLRGAGPRGIAGMPAMRDIGGVRFVRPLLDVSRGQTRAACEAQGLRVWTDPHNSDPAFARSRARTLLGSLSVTLGPAVVANLARTAALVAADNAVLDDLAGAAEASAATPFGGLRVGDLATLPVAVRTRVLHRWVRGLGVAGGRLSHRHVAALDDLVTGWHGQGPAHLPGGVVVRRRDGDLIVVSGAQAPPGALVDEGRHA